MYFKYSTAAIGPSKKEKEIIIIDTKVTEYKNNNDLFLSSLFLEKFINVKISIAIKKAQIRPIQIYL